MAQDLLAPVAPLLPVLDLDNPRFLASAPPWLEQRIIAEARSENRRILRDETGRQIGEVRTLPKSLMLSGSERAVLSRRVAELEAALQPGPPETIIEHVGRILVRYLRNHSDDDLAVRAETYLDALDGLPGWTVREAVRRWFQGKCGGTVKDYDFAPSEARLRQVADGIVNATRGQAICFRRLLAAEVEPEISEAVRARQGAELAALVKGIRQDGHEREVRGRQAARPGPPADRATVAADLERRRVLREEREIAERATSEPPAEVHPVNEAEASGRIS